MSDSRYDVKAACERVWVRLQIHGKTQTNKGILAAELQAAHDAGVVVGEQSGLVDKAYSSITRARGEDDGK